MRLVTTEGELARRGFRDLARAVDLIDRLARFHEEGAADLVDASAAAIDPDQALGYLIALLENDPARIHSLVEDSAFARRVIAVMGASTDLGSRLTMRPFDLDELRDEPERRTPQALRRALLEAVGADPDSDVPVATSPTSVDDLRHAYRRALLRVAARDLTADDPLDILPDIAAELADLADAALEGALAVARASVSGHETCRLAVLALGKTGAQELNYISDVDVIFVAEPAIDSDGRPVVTPEAAVATGTRLAAALSRICSDHTAAGTIWQVDAGLRPEGKAGPLVRSLASMAVYYTKWAKNWEFQALLKARPAAGDMVVGQEFCDAVSPLVWAAGERDGFVAETQAMRTRVISLISAKEVDREIKLGPGGLRDTEFSVQLLQLVHGRGDDRLRLRDTLSALSELVAHGYVGREDGRRLGEAYRLQRLLEHRVQLSRMRRTHLLPDDEDGLRHLARAAGLPGPKEVVDEWRQSTRIVTRLHQRIFYSPLLEAVARIPTEQIRLTPDAAQTRLQALGYADPAAALRHIEALTTGMSRGAEIQRQLLPAMLGWFTEGPNPDHGLLAFRQLSEALGTTPWYLRALRDESVVAERLARIVSTSRYAVELLRRAPQQVELLASDDLIVPRPLTEIAHAMTSGLARHRDSDQAIEATWGVRRRELARVAMADLLGHAPPRLVGQGLTDIADATVGAMLEIARREVPGAPPIGVIACGSWGGAEMSYGSDADALFVIDDTDDPDIARKAVAVVTRVRAMLKHGGPMLGLTVDADLRPEGKNGPLVRTLSAYAAYYSRWSATWEAQALLRADASTGDLDVAERLITLIDPVRYPADGLSPNQVIEIRRLKARVETERMPRGVDPKRHVKLGPGGLSDVEWAVQLLQLQHAAGTPGLRTPKTVAALEAAVASRLIEEADADALLAAWLLAVRIRNASMLIRGKASDTLPSDSRELAQVAQVLGFGSGGASHLVESWSRTARLSKGVVDRIFWGDP